MVMSELKLSSSVRRSSVIYRNPRQRTNKREVRIEGTKCQEYKYIIA